MQFKDITGQENIKERLINTVNENRVSHAQLFIGPEGSGKLALAIAYAQYINCKDRKDNDSCGICPSCIKYNKLIHPDLHFVYPVASIKDIKNPNSKSFSLSWREFLTKNDYWVSLEDWYIAIDIENKQGIINAEDCNDIVKTISLKSFEAEYKVMILWMAEKLYYSAAPKILKILEEPPGKTLFILITQNQEQILNTILSRTQIVKVPKLKDSIIQTKLIEEHQLSHSEAAHISEMADGNFKKAKYLINQNEEENFNFKKFSALLRLCYQFKVVEINTFVNDISTIGREKQKSFLSYGLRLIRLCMLNNYENEEQIKLEGGEMKFVKNFSPFVNNANVSLFIEEINRAIFHIERNANAKILFMDLSLNLCKLLKIKPV